MACRNERVVRTPPDVLTADQFFQHLKVLRRTRAISYIDGGQTVQAQSDQQLPMDLVIGEMERAVTYSSR